MRLKGGNDRPAASRIAAVPSFRAPRSFKYWYSIPMCHALPECKESRKRKDQVHCNGRGQEASTWVSMKQSAGVLFYRQRTDGLEVLLIHASGNYNRKAPWGIPKGEPDEG